MAEQLRRQGVEVAALREEAKRTRDELDDVEDRVFELNSWIRGDADYVGQGSFKLRMTHSRQRQSSSAGLGSRFEMVVAQEHRTPRLAGLRTQPTLLSCCLGTCSH